MNYLFCWKSYNSFASIFQFIVTTHNLSMIGWYPKFVIMLLWRRIGVYLRHWMILSTSILFRLIDGQKTSNFVLLTHFAVLRHSKEVCIFSDTLYEYMTQSSDRFWTWFGDWTIHNLINFIDSTSLAYWPVIAALRPLAMGKRTVEHRSAIKIFSS